MYTHVGQADLIPGGINRSDSRTWGCFVATTEHPQRAEAIACARMCSMGQRAPSGRPILRAMSSEKHPGSVTNVQSGDVLVSHPTAVREHEISIVPNAPHTTSPTHDAAVSDGRSEADALGVDAWLTEDQTHVVKIASNRTPDK